MAQIIRITSEALQQTIRRLLPSQQGFGEDLQASNVIQPIIDLTPTAEGSALPDYLQTALAKDSQTSFDVEATTSNVITTPGFWRITGYAMITLASGAQRDLKWQITDGLSTDDIQVYANRAASNDAPLNFVYDFNIFLNSGETLVANAGAGTVLSGSVRQLADINGNLVNPAGFTPQ